MVIVRITHRKLCPEVTAVLKRSDLLVNVQSSLSEPNAVTQSGMKPDRQRGLSVPKCCFYICSLNKKNLRASSIISSYLLCNSIHCMRITGHLEEFSHAQHSSLSSSSALSQRSDFQPKLLSLLIVCLLKAALWSILFALICAHKGLNFL